MGTAKPLRVLCLEDNPLIAFHLEQMLEDLGHLPLLTLASFAQLQALAELEIDCALVDIDLADGRTGPTAARWLQERDITCVFVSGQQDIAEANRQFVTDIIAKPIMVEDLAKVLNRLKG
ncbi:MAG: response regulator [Alphaproteobacteria bacterium]|nr:MAG: response regulator [Alphaproteobacteria bacterium]